MDVIAEGTTPEQAKQILDMRAMRHRCRYAITRPKITERFLPLLVSTTYLKKQRRVVDALNKMKNVYVPRTHYPIWIRLSIRRIQMKEILEKPASAATLRVLRFLALLHVVILVEVKMLPGSDSGKQQGIPSFHQENL